MTVTTKAVAWIGAIFGTISIAVLALIIGAMMYAGHRRAEQPQAMRQLNEGLVNDAKTISKMEIKPMTEDDERKFWASPSPTK
jgi:hypothetical protein